MLHFVVLDTHTSHVILSIDICYVFNYDISRTTVEPVLCGLCNERPLVLNGRFLRHGLFLIEVIRDRFCSQKKWSLKGCAIHNDIVDDGFANIESSASIVTK